MPLSESSELKGNSSSSRTARSDDGQFGIEVSTTLLEEMSDLCARAYPKETGGILIGHYSTDLRVAHVTSLSSAPPDSVAKRFSFVRGFQGLQQLLRRVWRQKSYYLGEWHFHPDGEPSPSGTDSDQMQSIASAISYQCPEPVLLIVGGHPPEPLQFHSYVFRRGVKEVIPLQL